MSTVPENLKNILKSKEVLHKQTNTMMGACKGTQESYERASNG